MIRDITIGQYYPAKSVLHRLDPRVKLVGTLLYLISLFLFNSIPGYVMTTLFLIIIIKMSRVPFSFIVRGLKPVIMLLMITVLFNLFLTRDGAVLFHAWIFTITEGGIKDCGIYSNPSDLPDHRIVAYDIYNDSERADRWNRRVTWTTEQDPCSGT